MYWLKKLRSTIRMTYCMFMTRTFSKYHHSVGAYNVEYAVYSWRGKRWCVPTSCMSNDMEESKYGSLRS